ncbi:MAG: hypothetical protein MUF76_02195 [Hydrogenophaga sp.]|jgi:hypothetical protein|nr:hypothetical protein [Hydrogenophaga sp.]
MTRYNAPFEIHVHGDVPLREDVVYAQIQDALKPLWQYAGARSLAAAAESAYEDEPGIRFESETHVLQICWTVPGGEEFRQVIEETCMALNDIAAAGAPLEVSFYDTEYDEEDGSSEEEARDDFMMCFVGPTPAAIMQVQRDLLVQDVIHVMERHFDTAELGEVIAAVDKLFTQRFDALVNSMQLGKPPRGYGGPSGHGGPRKPRHLH